MMRVLVCDDDEVVLKVVELTLQQQNVETVLVRDGMQALEQLRKDRHFDLIITDIHMPYYTADDVLNLVRKEQGKQTPIIIVSSDGEDEVITYALKQGVNDFIVKPVSSEKLLKKIKPFIY